MEKKINFKNRLEEVDCILRELVNDDDVFPDTALYAFIMSAELSVSYAVFHVSELYDSSVCKE